VHTARYDGDAVDPPQYPTLESTRPFPCPNSRRNSCSTPQKQPAARVAFCGADDILRDGDSAAKARVGVVLNGRRMRVKRVGADAAKRMNQLDVLYDVAELQRWCLFMQEVGWRHPRHD
jgi:hypothetical protein